LIFKIKLIFSHNDIKIYTIPNKEMAENINNVESKLMHLDILDIVVRVSQDQDNDNEFVIHEMLRELMDNGFEIDHSILKEILNEKPNLSTFIQTLKNVEKDVKRMFGEFERFENQ